MVLLGLLDRGPAHGYELKAAHDEWFPSAKPLAFGQVYASLGRWSATAWSRRSRPDRSRDRNGRCLR